MVFSSTIFVFAFLPVTLLLYFIAEKTGRMCLKNAVVLTASLFFYLWGGLQYLLLLLACVTVNYFMGILIGKTSHKKLFLFLGILIDLSNLLFFKYLTFFLQNVLEVMKLWKGEQAAFPIPEIALPIGISFYTFQIISYLIDVYRGDVPYQKNILKLALYIMMFPQLIAGPIVRYSSVNEALEHRRTSYEMAERGLRRFILGFAKKVFIANSMGKMADTVFGITGQVNTAYAWIGAISYTLQIFFDFSAYSDMAIGLGWIFGFEFNENFDYPYISRSIREFWRRWHISLSSWFRDYVYIPLGGNRKGAIRTYFNLGIVFLLTGFWHGAAWQFIVWGIFHGFFMVLERLGWGKVLERLPKVLQRVYTLVLVVVGWVFFRADTLSQAVGYLKNMFSFRFEGWKNATVLFQFTNLYFVMLIVALVVSTPVLKKIAGTKIGKQQWLGNCLCLILWIVSLLYMVGLAYNPFIYFKF